MSSNCFSAGTAWSEGYSFAMVAQCRGSSLNVLSTHSCRCGDSSSCNRSRVKESGVKERDCGPKRNTVCPALGGNVEAAMGNYWDWSQIDRTAL
jgi:hypothetical protein